MMLNLLFLELLICIRDQTVDTQHGLLGLPRQ